VNSKLRASLATLLCSTGLTVTGFALAAPAEATFTGTDGSIAFVRSNQIYTIAASGGTATKLTTTGKNYRPEWSPDGTKIAYVNESSTGLRDVWLMNANGSGKTKVTSVGDVAQGVTWAPNGSRLALVSGGYLKWVRATAPFGTPQSFLGYETNDGANGDEPATERHPLLAQSRAGMNGTLAWSTNNRIAYLGNDSYFDWSLEIYNVGTAESWARTSSGGDCCGYTRWSEFFWGSSSKLGYSQALDEDYGTTYHPTSIVYPGVPTTENGDTGGAPSPSNTRIAVTNASSGTSQIYVSNLNGSGRRLLTQGYQPDWQSR
jgi:hypothetical protein